MKGLQKFSVRGLRRFQNILFIAGLLLLPFVFFVDALEVKYLLSLSFIGIFLGFRKAEQIIGMKLRLKKRKQATQNVNTLYEECTEALQHMERLFVQKGYSIQLHENEILDGLYRKLNNCSTLKDFLYLKERIHKQLFFVSGLDKNKSYTNEKKSYQEKKQSKQTERPASNHTLSQPLQVLGLPEGTKDMVVIKNAYKKLIKQYHPDLNPSAEAGEKTVQINLAYEQVKKYVEAS